MTRKTGARPFDTGMLKLGSSSSASTTALLASGGERAPELSLGIPPPAGMKECKLQLVNFSLKFSVFQPECSSV